MTALELYVVVGIPLLLLVIGGLSFFLDRPSDHHRTH